MGIDININYHITEYLGVSEMMFVKNENCSLATTLCLGQHPWFRMLPQAALDTLSAASRMVVFSAHDELFAQGQPCDECLLICTGEVQGLRYTESGEEKIFGTVRPGSFVAVPSLFAQPAQHWHTIRAHSNGTACLVGGQALRAVCAEHPALALQIIEQNARLLYHHTEQIDWLTSSTAEQRLADYILRFGDIQANGLSRLPLSWSQIATKLGMRAETLSRMLAKWRRQGLVQQKRSLLHVLDAAALKRIVRTHREI